MRRIRGLISIAIVWGAAISVLGTAFIAGSFAAGWIPHIPGMSWTQWLALMGGVAVRDFVGGVASGIAFGLLLTGAERRRTLESLSLRRVGAWGFLASAVPTGIVGLLSGPTIPPVTLVVGTLATGLIGAGLGVGMVRLARRNSSTLPAESVASIS